MPWTVQWHLGVKTDARGRKFRILANSFGRQDIQYIQDSDAPAGYSIPIPEERKPVIKLKGKPIDTSTGKPVVHIPRRKHVVLFRRRGEKEIIREEAPNGSNGLAALIDSNLCRYDGKEWFPLFPSLDDHHVQWHEDEEVK